MTLAHQTSCNDSDNSSGSSSFSSEFAISGIPVTGTTSVVFIYGAQSKSNGFDHLNSYNYFYGVRYTFI